MTNKVHRVVDRVRHQRVETPAVILVPAQVPTMRQMEDPRDRLLDPEGTAVRPTNLETLATVDLLTLVTALAAALARVVTMADRTSHLRVATLVPALVARSRSLEAATLPVLATALMKSPRRTTRLNICRG